MVNNIFVFCAMTLFDRILYILCLEEALRLNKLLRTENESYLSHSRGLGI